MIFAPAVVHVELEMSCFISHGLLRNMMEKRGL
jgi:hypothetical protein